MNKFTIEDLNLYYGAFQALKNINIILPEKQITAFIGPSGCGKSTLLKTLNRMNDLVEGCRITGKVLLEEEDIYGDMDINLLRKRVGMVFQKPNPFPMTVYDNIAYGPRTHGIRSKVKLWKNHCARQRSGTKSKTVSRKAPWVFPAASSNGFVLQERSP